MQINDPIVKGELQMNVSNFINTPNSKFHNFKLKNFFNLKTFKFPNVVKKTYLNMIYYSNIS